MVRQTWKICILILLLSTGAVLIPSRTHPEEKSGVRLMIEEHCLGNQPRNFRSMSDPPRSTDGRPVDLSGLSSLRASGSGQFSEGQLAPLRKALGAEPVLIVDLRQESHGFINGIAVSWCGEGNCANLGKSRRQAEEDELRRLECLRKKGGATAFRFVPGDEGSPGQFIPESMKVGTISSEEELSRAYGFGYIRFPIPDHRRPPDGEVDLFVSFVRELPGNAWLHFHCKAGVGRTTTFLAMYDMMRNAGNVSLPDIIKRQLLLGGMDLSLESALAARGDLAALSVERAQFTARFYEYCRANDDGFRTSWTAWLKKQEGARSSP